MLLARDANGKLGPFDATDTLDKPCYDYKGLSRASAVPRRHRRVAAQRRHRRLPDRPRGRERPVRGELHLRRCAEVRRQLHLREDGGQRDRAQARHDRDLHAQAVLQPHRQRRALPHLASATTSTKNLFDDDSDKQRPGAVDAGLSLPRRRAGACARAGGDVRADGQFLQAAGRRARAVRRDLGAGLHRLRRQQPHRLRAHSRRAARIALAGLGLQSVSRHCRPSSPRAWTASTASSIRASRPTSTSTSVSRQQLARAGIGAAAAEPARSDRRAREGRSREGGASARSSPRSSSRSSAWSGSSTRAMSPTGRRSATWSSSDVWNRRTAAEEAGAARAAGRADGADAHRHDRARAGLGRPGGVHGEPVADDARKLSLFWRRAATSTGSACRSELRARHSMRQASTRARQATTRC